MVFGDIHPPTKEGEINSFKGEGQRARSTPFWVRRGEDGRLSPHAGSPARTDVCSFVASSTKATTTARDSTIRFLQYLEKWSPGTWAVLGEEHSAKPVPVLATFGPGVFAHLFNSSCSPIPLGRRSGSYQALSDQQARSYTIVKEAILERLGLTTEAYHHQFRREPFP